MHVIIGCYLRWIFLTSFGLVVYRKLLEAAGYQRRTDLEASCVLGSGVMFLLGRVLVGVRCE